MSMLFKGNHNFIPISRRFLNYSREVFASEAGLSVAELDEIEKVALFPPNSQEVLKKIKDRFWKVFPVASDHVYLTTYADAVAARFSSLLEDKKFKEKALWAIFQKEETEITVVEKNNFNKYKNGSRTISLLLLARIAAFCDLNPYSLFLPDISFDVEESFPDKVKLKEWKEKIKSCNKDDFNKELAARLHRVSEQIRREENLIGAHELNEVNDKKKRPDFYFLTSKKSFVAAYEEFPTGGKKYLPPPLIHLAKLFSYFYVDLNYLIGLSDEPFLLSKEGMRRCNAVPVILDSFIHETEHKKYLEALKISYWIDDPRFVPVEVTAPAMLDFIIDEKMKFSMPPELLSRILPAPLPTSSPEHFLSILIEDDAMSPTLCKREVVTGVKIAYPAKSISPGLYILKTSSGELKVRRVGKISSENFLEITDNKNYDPQEQRIADFSFYKVIFKIIAVD